MSAAFSDAPAAIVTIVHTSFLAVESLTALFAELGPDVALGHRVEDGLLAEVMAAGGVTANVRTRLLGLFCGSADAGCDVVLSQCSSVGDVAEEAARELGVPVLRIDEPMAEQACRIGGRIGIVATLATTLDPTRRLLEATAARLSARVELEERLVEGAFARLEAGERAEHDRQVLAAVRKLEDDVDVVVCAQGSMAAILPRLGETRVPVLTSPRLGVAHAVDVARRRARRRAGSA